MEKFKGNIFGLCRKLDKFFRREWLYTIWNFQKDSIYFPNCDTVYNHVYRLIEILQYLWLCQKMVADNSFTAVR